MYLFELGPRCDTIFSHSITLHIIDFIASSIKFSFVPILSLAILKFHLKKNHKIFSEVD